MSLIDDVKKAEQLFKEGNFFQAEDLFNTISKKFPNKHQGQAGLARVAMQNQQWEQALNLWNQAIQKSPQNFIFYLEKGNTLIQLKKFEQAVAVFKTFSCKFPDKHQGLAGLARIAMQNQQWEQALNFWNQTIQKSPQNFIFYLEKGNTLIQLGRFEAATQIFELFNQKFPDKHHGLAGLARITMQTQQWETALELWEQVIEQFPNDLVGYIEKGNTLIQLGRFEAATQIFELFNQKFPDKHHGLAGLARITIQKDESKQALNLWEKVIQQFPDDLVGYVEKGNVLVQLGQFHQAEAVYQTLEQKFLYKNHGLAGLARIAMQTQQWETALNLWEQIVQKFPYELVGYIEKGNTLVQLEKYQEAEDVFRSLQIRYHHKTNILERLTFLAEYTGNWALAEEKWLSFLNRNTDKLSNLYPNYSLLNSIERSIYKFLGNNQLSIAESLINLINNYCQDNYILDKWKARLDKSKGYFLQSDSILEKAITIYPEYTLEWLWELALNAWDNFNFDRIIELCQKIESVEIITFKDQNILYQTLVLSAQTLIRMDREEDAVKQLNKAIDLYPSNSSAYIFLLDIQFFYEKDYGSALRLSNLAIKKGVWHRQIILYRAISLSALGETQYALNVVDKYIETVPSDKLALIYRVQLLRDDGQYAAALRQLNDIYVEGGFAPIESIGNNFEFSVPHVQCFPQHQITEREMVSVIMTIYKRNELLSVAINSILNQTYRNLELIIVDDASPDDTWEWLQEFANKNSRIRLIKMKENSGTYVAKNEGISRAKGDYIALMDSDDWIHPQTLETQINILKNSDAVAVASSFFRVDLDSCIEYKPEPPMGFSFINICYKKDPVFTTIGFFDAIRTAGDTEHLERMRLVFGKNLVKQIDYPLLISLRSSTSITGGGSFGFAWYGPGGKEHIYWANLRKWHKLICSENRDPYMPHPLDYRRFDVPNIMLP